MKQKIVIKVQMNCDKCKSKALKIVAKVEGVTSVALEGTESDRVVVIGDGVDAACLTRQLRKKMAFASIVSVQEEKGKVEPPKVVPPKVEPNYFQCQPYYFQCQPCRMYEVGVICHDYPDSFGCSIL